MTRLGLAKTRHRRLFAFELRRWGYAARERWSIVAMARIAAIFCRSRDDPAAANPAKPLLTLRSHAVRSPWPCPVCRNTRQKGDVGSRGAGSSGPARHARRWMGGEFTSPSRISSAIISVEKPCKKTSPLAASRNNPSLMTSACRASNLHRAILLPSDNLVNVVWCTQGH